jgi:hypothetical protein
VNLPPGKFICYILLFQIIEAGPIFGIQVLFVDTVERDFMKTLIEIPDKYQELWKEKIRLKCWQPRKN